MSREVIEGGRARRSRVEVREEVEEFERERRGRGVGIVAVNGPVGGVVVRRMWPRSGWRRLIGVRISDCEGGVSSDHGGKDMQVVLVEAVSSRSMPMRKSMPWSPVPGFVISSASLRWKGETSRRVMPERWVTKARDGDVASGVKSGQHDVLSEGVREMLSRIRRS